MKKVYYFFAILLIVALSACSRTSTIADLPSHYATMEDGTKIHYKSVGDGNIVLLFVHGFGCDMQVWEKQYEGFDGDPIQMIFVDLPGYGESDKPETEYTLSYFSQALKTVLDSLQVSKAVLVGHSLGTAVCRQFIFDYPAQAVALCDIDGTYCFYPSNPTALLKYKTNISAFVDGFRGEGCEQYIKDFVESLQGPFTPQEIVDYAMSTMPNTPEYVASSTMTNLVDPDYWTGEKINIPSLIICTRASNIPADNKQIMDHLYNDFTYVEFDNTGHFIMMEDSGVVNNLIERSYERWRQTEL